MGYPISSILGRFNPSITEGIISKNRGFGELTGEFQITAPMNKGNSGGPIFNANGEIVGMALRSKENKKPIYISTAHRSDLTSAIKLTKQLVKIYRLPEPVRLAQLAANQQKDGRVIDVVVESKQGSLF